MELIGAITIIVYLLVLATCAFFFTRWLAPKLTRTIRRDCGFPESPLLATREQDAKHKVD